MSNATGNWLRNQSGVPRGDRLLRLWKHSERDVFVMDNHLAALFCWLGTLTSDQPYRLFHIDHHWDMTDMEEGEIEILESRCFSDLERLDEFSSLKSYKRFEEVPLVNYTNYISPLPYLRPKLVNAVLGADQEKYPANIDGEPKFTLVSIRDFFKTVETFLPMKFEGRTLFNVDIDLFFKDFGVDADRAYDDDVIERLASLIRPTLDLEGTVLTIALSPEFCGYGRAERICSQLCELLRLHHPF